MVADPAATPVTTPVLLTVATPVLSDVQVPEPVAVDVPVNVVVCPTQTDTVPVTIGNGFTDTVAEAGVVPHALVTLSVILFVPLLIYVMDPGFELVEVVGVPLGKLQLYVVLGSM